MLAGVITGLRIENLRGVRAGELSGLSNLTILLGPNGSGKSALLDALLIGGSSSPGEAVGRAVKRRVAASTGARWLLWKSGAEGPATIGLDATDGGGRQFRIDPVDPADLKQSTWGEQFDFGLQVQVQGHGASWTVLFEYRGQRERSGLAYTVKGISPFGAARFVRMIDPAPGANQEHLARLFQRVKEAGQRAFAEDLLREVVPDCTGLDATIDDVDRPDVGVVYGGEVPRVLPVGLAGDGVYVLTRVALELANCPAGGVALLEEPEVHQYPRTLWRIAQAIIATVARGVQVILSTHSAELVRMLLDQAQPRDLLGRTAVFNLHLRGGQLVASRTDGATAIFAVDALGEDLR